MKRLIGQDLGTYSFNAADQRIALVDIPSLTLEQILVITNVTDGIIIYNFADPALTATLSNNILTLQYDTSTMSDTDSLQIWVDIPEATVESNNLLDDILTELKRIRFGIAILTNVDLTEVDD